MTNLNNQYVSQIEILCSNLTVSFKYFADDLNINKDFVFRNTTAFVNQIEIFRRRYVFNSWYIIHVCLQEIVYKWYVNASKHIRKTINNDAIDQLCNQLLICDKIYEQEQRQQQIKFAISKIIKRVSSKDELNYYIEASFTIKSTFVSASSSSQNASTFSMILNHDIIISSLAQNHKTSVSSASSAMSISSFSSISSAILNASITFFVTSIFSSKISQTTITVKASITFSSSSFQTIVQLRVTLSKTSKAYMTINDLYRMFAKKRFRKSLNAVQKKMFSFVFRQTHIINYFKSIVQFILFKSFKIDVFAISFSSTSKKLILINIIVKNIACKQIFISSMIHHAHVSALINIFQNFKINILTFKRVIFTYNNHVSLIFDEVHNSVFNNAFRNSSASAESFKFKAISSSSTFRVLFSINNKQNISQMIDRLKKLSKDFHQCRRCFRVYCSDNELHKHIVNIHIELRRRRFSKRNHRFRDFIDFWRI